jgi:hypothetical protein
MEKTIRFVIGALLFAVVSGAQAQIVVEGVADTNDYYGTVTFRVLSEAGYTYNSMLDGQHINEDKWIPVSRPMYHQIDVTRTNDVGGGTTETSRVRFAILDADRKDAERGLWPWVPWPPIDSSSNECLSASLLIVAPSNYPPNLDIPVVAVLPGTSGLWKRVNGTVTLSGFTNSIHVKRGVGHTFLAGQQTGTVLSVNAAMKSISTNKVIAIDNSNVWTNVSADITTNTTWGKNSRIHIANSITVVAGARLTIMTGTVVRLEQGADMNIDGRLVVNGSTKEPVVFTPNSAAQPWGGINLWMSTSIAVINGAIFAGAGNSPTWMLDHGVYAHHQEQALFFLSAGSTFVATNAFIVSLAGQGFHGEQTSLRLDSCLLQKCQTAGQFNGFCTNFFYNSALLDFPADNYLYEDSDRDGPYCNSIKFTFVETMIGWAQDDCIDGGNEGSSIVVSNGWHEAAFHEGMSPSSDGEVVGVSDTVFVGCGQGVEAGWGAPTVYVNHCLAVNNEVGFRFGDNYLTTANGNLFVSNSISIYNDRDYWNMCFDIWQPRLDNVGLTNNYFSTWYPDYPSNSLWNAASNSAMLVPFIQRASALGPVGVGFPLPAVSNIESVTSAYVDVMLSMFSTGYVTVAYGAVGGTATPNVDYTNSSGTLTFAPGEIRKQIHFAVIDDSIPEPDETIVFALSNAVNCEISSRQSNLTYTIKKYGAPSDTYVVAGNANAQFPYTNWMIAASNIQDAVEISMAGRTVFVSNGTYRVSGPVIVAEDILLRSVNGAAYAIIDGGGSAQCLYLSATGSVVDGFTLTGGTAVNGAGCQLVGGGVVQNCIVSNNVASQNGGGAYLVNGGTIKNCFMTHNTALNGGAVRIDNNGAVDGCNIAGNTTIGGSGGGIYCLSGGTVTRCVIFNNHSDTDKAGGVYCRDGGLAQNCVISGNSALVGGGAYARNGGTVENCTIVSNSAIQLGNGIYCTNGAIVRSSIIAGNAGANWDIAGSNAISSTCSTPQLPGVGNIAGDPLFVSFATGDYRLQLGSPCIDAVSNEPPVTEDLDGTPRPLDGNADGVTLVDMGAYEFASPAVDTDGDGMSDADEVIAGTSPTNKAQCLKIYQWGIGAANPSVASAVWSSVIGRHYAVETTTNMEHATWMNVLQSSYTNVPGSGLPLVYTNTWLSDTARFFRVRVRWP